VPATDLGITDERAATALASDKTGKTGAPTVREVEPLVLPKRAMLVRAGRRVEEQ
jgi:hypothetical protein